VLRQLDALSSELHMISEHAVQLDANFSKYGYSAHLRTRDSGDEDGGSIRDSTFDKETWHAGRKLGETMRFYQKPIVRQYFHKGLLWRAREAQEVASYELFIDLFYVGIIAVTGDTAAEHPDGQSLLRFVITFIMGWKFWTDISLLISWFDSDDVLRRCSVLFILTCLLGFTTNMVDAFEHTYTPLVAFYVTARLYLIVSLFWYSYQIPMVRASMIGNGAIALIPVALWIGSIHVEEPSRQGLIWIAIVFDLFGGFLLIMARMPGIERQLPASWKERLEFYPGVNIEHRIERTNAFVTLVFGSCVLGILYQSSSAMGVNAFFGKAVLGLVQAFIFNWIYFEIDSFNLHTHAIRRHVWTGRHLVRLTPIKLTCGTAMAWYCVHLPFIMSFVLSAGALAVLVRAHDCPNAEVDTLYETFVGRSEDHISQGLVWYYCGGLGVSLICLALIAWSHTHRKIPNQRIKKNFRLLFRVVVAVVIICLPLAHLDSLELVATTTALIACVLVLELVGSTCWGESFWWNTNCGRNKCTYSAKCGVKKEEIEESLKNGTVLNVEEIARREAGEKGSVGAV
jgi:low temperature requirement protein LtrA